MNQYDYTDRDLDDEELYGTLEEFTDRDTGERYTINPFTGSKNYVDGE